MRSPEKPERPAPEPVRGQVVKPPVWLGGETHSEFLARRALEENRLAGAARAPKAAAAHRYLAAAYSAELAREIATAAALEELLLGVA